MRIAISEVGAASPLPSPGISVSGATSGADEELGSSISDFDIGDSANRKVEAILLPPALASLSLIIRFGLPHAGHAGMHAAAQAASTAFVLK